MIVYNEKDEKPALVFMVEICLFFFSGDLIFKQIFLYPFI